MKRLFVILAVIVLMFSVVSCSTPATEAPTPADTPAEPAAEETTEPVAEDLSGTTVKVLLAYGGADKSFEAFTEATGIKVEFIEISTGKALAQMQAANGVSDADVWFGGGIDSYLSAKDLDYLMAYPSTEAEGIAPEYKDADGYWTTLALVPAGFLVNTEVLEGKGLEIPTTWEDLADPMYKGEIIMASPGISGTQYAIVNGLIQALGEEAGWDLWQRIDANIDQYAQGGGEPAPKTVAGEFGIGVLAITGGTFALEDEGPVQVVVPEDFIPWTPAPIGIFNDAKNVAGAKAMIDYYLSLEGQEKLLEADARIMSRSEIAIPEVMKEIDPAKLIKQDVLLFGTQREELLQRWDDMIK